MSRTYGNDILEGHGDFAIDNDPFFTINAGWTVSGGVATFNSASSVQLTKPAVLVVGKMYEYKFTVSAVTGAGVRVLIGSTGVGIARTTTGTFTEVLTCSGTNTIFLQGIAGATATVDNLVVREVLSYNNISVALSRGLRI